MHPRPLLRLILSLPLWLSADAAWSQGVAGASHAAAPGMTAARVAATGAMPAATGPLPAAPQLSDASTGPVVEAARPVAEAAGPVVEAAGPLPLPLARPEFVERPEYPHPSSTAEFSTAAPLRPRPPMAQHSTRRSTASGASSFAGRLYCVMTEALCGGDACYDPQWHLIEAASFWVGSARPQNRTRFRWDYGPEMILPDRAEYFWARVGGRGPAPPPGAATFESLDYHELSLYTETAHGNFSAFVITPYRSLYLDQWGHAAGFGDVRIGTKSLLHDTPLLRVALQMTTSIPAANPRKGLGVGHVSLEPALLFGLAMTDRDFMQAEVAEWIPLGGDPAYQGALMRWGVSWNRITWQRDADNLVTANLDLIGWSFQDGAYTDPVLGTQAAGDETYLYLGPGVRWLMCGRFEVGIGQVFAVSDQHFAERILRTDLSVCY